MKRSSRVHLQFGSHQTNSDGEGDVVIDSASNVLNETAVILTPNDNVNATAFEISTNTYHVTVSAKEVVTVNYLTVSSD